MDAEETDGRTEGRRDGGRGGVLDGRDAVELMHGRSRMTTLTNGQTEGEGERDMSQRPIA